MRPGESYQEREPVVFDISTLPEGFGGKEGGVFSAFAFNRVRFDSDLHTAVAKSHGINDAGELDMEMLGSVEATADYLRGRNGQPLVIADTVTDTDSGKIVFLNGYIATLSDSPDPVGLHEGSNGPESPGIAVDGGYTWFHSYALHGRLDTQYLQPRESATIPFASQDLIFGHTDVKIGDRDQKARQEVVAGEDIVPWILDNFGEGEEGYHVYMNIVWALSRGEGFEFKQLEPMLAEPFMTTAQAELQMLQEFNAVLTTYRFRVINANRVLEGYKGEANLALDAIAKAHPQFRHKIPKTADSYPAEVASSLDDPYGEQVEQRIKAIARHLDPVTKIVSQARQGKI